MNTTAGTTETTETLPSPKKMLGIASRFAAFDHALNINEVADVLGLTRKRLNEWRGLTASHLSKSVIRFVSIPAYWHSGRRLPGATSGSVDRDQPSAGSV